VKAARRTQHKTAREGRKTIVGRIDPEVLRFTAGKDRVLDIALAEAECFATAAHATMLSRIGGKATVVTEGQKKRIIRALAGIVREVRSGSFRISQNDQDIHLAVERRLTRKLGDLGRRIHTARSRNDQVAVDLRLYGKEQLLCVMDETLELGRALLKLARRHAAVPMVGRTHMQPAMPSSVGLWASAHAESLRDDISMQRSAYDFNDRCPLGSAAGYGVALNIDRRLTARLLGFRGLHENVLYAGNARGKCETVILSALSQVMLSLSRLSEDLILYSTPEFGYFVLPPEYCTGSSIMPQKSNPDVLELIRAKTTRVLGYASTAAGIVKGLTSGYGRDLQETKEPFIDGMQTARACVRILTALVKEINVDKKALLAGFRPEVFAADRALELVGEGVPFRDAYNHVKKHLGELEKVDYRRAVVSRTHLRTQGGMNFDESAAHFRGIKTFVSRERKRYYGSVRRLLGVEYPAPREREVT